jgi:hypothetical protein
VAITGRTEKACFDQFTAHVQRLVSKTLTPTGQVRTLASPERMVLSFVGDTRTIKIVTRVGPLFFYLGQALEAVADPI